MFGLVAIVWPVVATRSFRCFGRRGGSAESPEAGMSQLRTPSGLATVPHATPWRVRHSCP